MTTAYVVTEQAHSRTNQQSLALHRLAVLAYTGTIQSQEAAMSNADKRTAIALFRVRRMTA